MKKKLNDEVEKYCPYIDRCPFSEGLHCVASVDYKMCNWYWRLLKDSHIYEKRVRDNRKV